MPTLEQIQQRMKTLQAQAEALIAKRASAVIADIRKLMVEHGLTTADIEAYTGKAKASVKRGPKPGFKRAGKSAAAAPAKKAASQTKGKLPEKYVNPKTGETWSGWARPPAWIKDVKDRSKFLIAGAAAGPAAGAGTSNKAKPTATKAVGKKAAAKRVKAATVPTAKKTAAKEAVSAKAAARKRAATEKVAGKRAAPVVKKASRKAPATKAAVAKRVVAKADVAAAPEAVTAQATA
jgi:DNA-binding protein H-NS